MQVKPDINHGYALSCTKGRTSSQDMDEDRRTRDYLSRNKCLCNK